ncbi:MAG: 50S ribosomal protein L17, partial [Pseudonocardiaceae bacterium]
GDNAPMAVIALVTERSAADVEEAKRRAFKSRPAQAATETSEEASVAPVEQSAADHAPIEQNAAADSPATAGDEGKS